MDSDNDGITDRKEQNQADLDRNGRIDGFVDNNNDGLDDNVAANPITLLDTDGDGRFNHLDRDADNDGITDPIEAGGKDTNGEGVIDGFADNTGAVNGLKDGWNDATAAKPLLVQDVDNDGLPAFLDLDSDNDGLTDILEAGGIDRDTDGNGLVDNFTDVDNDGLADIILYNPYINPDSDNDGVRNFLDLDSDNDGIVDAIESGRQVDVKGPPAQCYCQRCQRKRLV